MAIESLTDFLETLSQHRLLESEQLRQLGAETTVAPRDLARELVRRGWLTPYQVNQIFLGHAADLLLGSYVLLDRLGEGGMGAVYKARNWKLGRIVALKVIRKERLAHPDSVRRFHREIRAVSQLNHPNIVRAYDADEVNGTHFLVMEYVEGIDLAQRVKKQGPLPAGEACAYIRQAALGLQHAHERGLVHRDSINRKPVADFWKEEDDKQAAFDTWCKDVAKLPAEKQVEAVAAELKKRNPGFDGNFSVHIAGPVIHLNLPTEHITDIAPLRGFPSLLNVGLFAQKPGKGKLTDLWPLKGMPVTLLNCRNNPIADLPPVQQLPKLHTLNIKGTRVADLTPLQRSTVAILEADIDLKRDAAILRSIKTLQKINGRTVAEVLGK